VEDGRSNSLTAPEREEKASKSALALNEKGGRRPPVDLNGLDPDPRSLWTPQGGADAALLNSHLNLVHTVIFNIYGAGLGQIPWFASLERLRDPLWLKCGVVWMVGEFADGRGEPHSFGVDSEYNKLLSKVFDRSDPFFVRRDVKTAEDSRTVRSNSPFYTRWVQPQGLDHGICVRARICQPSAGEDEILVMVWREAHVRAFTRAQVELVWSFIPHYRAAAGLEFALRNFGRDWRVLSPILDQLPIGVVAICRDGRPLKINRWAAELVSACDGLFVSKNGLEAAQAADNRTLQLCIAGAFEGPGERVAPEIVLVQRESGEPLRVFAHSLQSGTAGQAREHSPVLVFICENALPSQEQALSNAYGLTTAEARIALMIASGHRLNTVAQQFGVSVSTARTHLQRIFNKTNTQRQVDLVRLILMSKRNTSG
jgi:DNA-binding CsgD family transcriptional regulator